MQPTERHDERHDEDRERDLYELDDPRAMRALSHPLRLRILERLQLGRPATATSLAEAFGESTASLSYHLGQLAKYGFIVEAPEAGQGRERPWKARRRELRVLSSQAGAAGRELRHQFLERHQESLRGFLASEDELPEQWYGAATFNFDTAWLTREEFEELSDRMLDLVLSYRHRVDPATRPESATRVRLLAYLYPDPEEES